jgi:hypothetical protein
MTNQTKLLIRASAAGAMLGVNPYLSPLGLYHHMRGELPDEPDNEAMMEGRCFEDAVAVVARKKFSLVIEQPDASRVEMSDGPLIGHIDREMRDGSQIGVVEIKNPFSGGHGQEWGDSGSDVVPKHYYIQSLVYQGLLRATIGGAAMPHGLVIARLSGVQRFVIPWDAQVYDRIKAEAEAFLRRVRDGNPPDPRDEADMRRRWLVDDEKVAVADDRILSVIESLRTLRKGKKAAEQGEKDLVALLLGFAKDCAKITDPETGKVVASLGCDRSFDAERFQREQPEVAALFQKLDTTRLGKEQRVLYEAYMSKPTNPADQKRVVRLPEVKS